MHYIWVIPLLPGLGAAVNGLVGIRVFSRRTAGFVACALMTAALGLSLLAFYRNKETVNIDEMNLMKW